MNATEKFEEMLLVQNTKNITLIHLTVTTNQRFVEAVFCELSRTIILINLDSQ